jgi:hypothetical protein
MQFENDLKLLELILARLERIPVDSRLAHRASGLRGSILTAIDKVNDREIEPVLEMNRLLDYGFYILERAAHERVQGSAATKNRSTIPMIK